MVKSSLENKRILILEDDPLLALDLEDFFTELVGVCFQSIKERTERGVILKIGR